MQNPTFPWILSLRSRTVPDQKASDHSIAEHALKFLTPQFFDTKILACIQLVFKDKESGTHESPRRRGYPARASTVVRGARDGTGGTVSAASGLLPAGIAFTSSGRIRWR